MILCEAAGLSLFPEVFSPSIAPNGAYKERQLNFSSLVRILDHCLIGGMPFGEDLTEMLCCLEWLLGKMLQKSSNYYHIYVENNKFRFCI